MRSVADGSHSGVASLGKSRSGKVNQASINKTGGPSSAKLPVQKNHVKLKSVGRSAEVSAGRRRSHPPPIIEEEDYEESMGHDNDNDEVGSRSSKMHMRKEDQTLVVYGKHENESDTWESEGEGEIPKGVLHRDVEESEHAMEVHVNIVAEETTKRKERRHAQAMREKEALGRKKEGHPMNFLLVDEQTKKPYGLGVGDWRKELMLLSKNLDPAIGNINQQPEGALAEIAEWIQHTWEYSSRVKFSYVKEVIARGVTLRRADLWKKIRNNEDKPDKLSNRSWRILEKQMQSPATIRKSESCSKANASRVNFGRTGPFGEVGVRERLRRTFRRSPDPEEMRFEMARNKGYGGHYRRKKENMNVMQNRDKVEHFLTEGARSPGRSGNSFKSMSPCSDNDKHSVGKRNIKNNGSPVEEISEMEILQHPIVLKMMQRLEALEGRQTGKVEDVSATARKSRSFTNVHTVKRQRIAAEDEDDGEGDDNVRAEGTLKSRRLHMQADYE